MTADRHSPLSDGSADPRSQSRGGSGSMRRVECEITESSFASEAEAEAAMTAMGWQGFAVDLAVTADEDFHWHDVDQIAYIISGTARTRLQDGTVLEAPTG